MQQTKLIALVSIENHACSIPITTSTVVFQLKDCVENDRQRRTTNKWQDLLLRKRHVTTAVYSLENCPRLRIEIPPTTFGTVTLTLTSDLAF